MQERSGWPVARSPRGLPSRPLRRRQGPASANENGPAIAPWMARPAGWASIIRSVVESDLVHQVGRRLLMVGDLGQRNGIGIELAVPRDGGIDGDARAHRIFVVQVRIHMLRLLTDQPLDQFHGVTFVGRVAGQDDGGQVHMRASVLEARKDDLGRLRPRFAVGLVVEHQGPIIGIGDADVAFAGRDVAGDLAVAARWFLREIGFEAAEPFFGLGFAVMGDEGRKQRVVVNVLARADADLALPFRIGEVFVVQSSLLHALLRGVDHARAHGNAVPVPSGSRYWGATILSSTSDLIGCVMPARTASSMRPISTVSSTSAGLLAPSALMRCSRPELAEMTLTLTPVSLVKASNNGWMSLLSR